MTMIQRYWGSDRFYHHTAPISMNYALREALALVVEEGLEARLRPARANAGALKAGLAAMGIGIADRRRAPLPQLTCVRIPDGIDDLAVRKRLLNDWGIEIGGGLGVVQGQGLADRPDGPRLAAGERDAGPGRAGDLPPRPRRPRRARRGPRGGVGRLPEIEPVLSQSERFRFAP